MKKIPVIIDADTGIDDSVALAVACYLKKLNILLITSAQGNASVENTTQNTLNILHAINKTSIPVAKGSGGNLSDVDITAGSHGATGLGNYAFPKHEFRSLNESAIQAIHNALIKSSQPVTLIALGPLTNFAETLRQYPDDKKYIAKIVISGGLNEILKEGKNPYLSFNIAEDSVAVEEIIQSNIPLAIVPSNMGHDAYLTWHDVFRTKHTNKTGFMLEQIFRYYRDRHIKNGIATHDLCAILAVATPIHFYWQKANIKIKYFNNLGYIDFDFLRIKNNSTTNMVQVTTGCNVKKIKQIYFKALKHMP